jgi:hypothetical protein
MNAAELEHRFAELKEKCAKLPEEDQARALDGFNQVVTLLELPREKGEAFSLSISVEHSGGVTHRSG